MDSTIAPGVSSDVPLSTTQMHHHNMKPMWMWFHTKINDLVLFESWIVTTPGGMVWTCFVVMAMGILLEFVRYSRWRMELANRKELLLSTKYATFNFHRSQSYASRLFSLSHIIQTICFGFQLVLSYFLMLIFMTFSVWLGLAVCESVSFSLAQGQKQPRRYAVTQKTINVASHEDPRFPRDNQRHCKNDDENVFSFSYRGADTVQGMDASKYDSFLPSNLGRAFHMLSSSIYFVQMFLAYSLMMISMTYNVPIFLSMIIGYVFSCIGVALIAAVYELTKYVRSTVERKANHQNLCACHSDASALHNKVLPAPGMPCGITSAHRKTELPYVSAFIISSTQNCFLPSNLGRAFHMLSSSIYFVQMFLAYSLMMISMTYNVPIFLSMIIGHVVSFFFLGPLISVQQYERLGDCCG
ncbi:Ctr copper transporter family protein [Oesophagostomum dentatum]|uniref:Copper transport protein n=1 Tax=Oesophagostomum dentatum TaxID=61180 RepID=A0A0B1T7P8_OESDE|nr:Ctr copper transporter family protein [Oesophagostomum dentatum]